MDEEKHKPLSQLSIVNNLCTSKRAEGEHENESAVSKDFEPSGHVVWRLAHGPEPLSNIAVQSQVSEKCEAL